MQVLGNVDRESLVFVCVISPCYGCVNVSYTATHDRTANLHTTNLSTWTLIKVSWSILSLHPHVHLTNSKTFLLILQSMN